MSFADFYFERFKTYNTNFPKITVNPQLKISVVIPSYREFRLFDTLNCLRNCQTQAAVEVIVLFNSKLGEDPQIIEMHQHQAQRVPDFSTDKIKFIPVIEQDLPRKIAGAGLARKLGMDLALHRFNQINNPEGIIISLDADTLCEKNYLSAIDNEFNQHPKAPGATIAFEHPIEGSEFPEEIYQAIILYELYMRYYIQALRYIKFPYAFHTVGSAFAVRAWAYAKQGGMGLHQAGEDFYFLHKIIPLGNFFEIKSTKVYPSPRVSNRVPFGTGPVVRQIISQKLNDYPTYPLEAFLQMKPLFENAQLLFTQNWQKLNLSPILWQFLEQNKFSSALEQMRANSAGKDTFIKRFFSWFDAFRILKFLNFATEKELDKKPVTEESQKLLQLLNIKRPLTTKELLLTYRQIQNN